MRLSNAHTFALASAVLLAASAYADDLVINPDCYEQFGYYLGDGICDSYLNTGPNTAVCGYDAGDCDEFNAKYPDCKSEFLVPLSDVGNGECNGYFNTAECEYDGGDCEEFNANFPDCSAFFFTGYGYGNGATCDGGLNNEECGYDGGDCDAVNTLGKDPFHGWRGVHDLLLSTGSERWR